MRGFGTSPHTILPRGYACVAAALDTSQQYNKAKKICMKQRHHHMSHTESPDPLPSEACWNDYNALWDKIPGA